MAKSVADPLEVVTCLKPRGSLAGCWRSPVAIHPASAPPFAGSCWSPSATRRDHCQLTIAPRCADRWGARHGERSSHRPITVSDRPCAAPSPIVGNDDAKDHRRGRRSSHRSPHRHPLFPGRAGALPCRDRAGKQMGEDRPELLGAIPTDQRC
jgi:hypothetical protein